MAGSKSTSKTSLIGHLGSVAPGLPRLLKYQRLNLSHDFVAGLSVAAVGRHTEWRLWAESRKRASSDRKIRFYTTFREVIRQYQSVEALRSESP